MAHHYYRIRYAELPTVEDELGFVRVANEDELAGFGLFRIDGDYFLVPCVDPCDGHPGTEVASGFLLERHEKLPAAARRRILRARAYRARDRRVNLRHQIERDEGETVEPRRRASKRIRALLRARFDQESEREDEDQRIRRRTVRRRTIDRVTVATDDLEDGDVVDEEDLVPLEVAGEIRGR